MFYVENVYMPSTKHFCENDQKLVEPSKFYLFEIINVAK